MKSLTLITKTKITADKISKKIIESFKWKKRFVQNDDGELFLGYVPHEFYIIYDDSCTIDDPLCLFDESDKKQIPFQNALVNELYYRDIAVAKYVVSIILNEYSELYICDENDNILSASDFLNSK